MQATQKLPLSHILICCSETLVIAHVPEFGGILFHYVLLCLYPSRTNPVSRRSQLQLNVMESPHVARRLAVRLYH
jgi:hypothetical protein